MQNGSPNTSLPENAVAIIGMSGRFPGAPDVRTFWNNLCQGIESLRRLDASELSRIAPNVRSRPEYVPVRGILDEVDCFDAAFFGISPREAESMDPQQRLFLECCWHALEDAGRIAERNSLVTGVFAGQSLNTYLLSNLCRDRAFIERITEAYQTGEFPVLFGNDSAFLATRVAHKLNLRGPAITLHSACSTSLVALVQAVQSLLSFQCDLCLAGGVSVSFPQERGHLYLEGSIGSPDGHCRPFDAAAAGTVFGGGVGVVVLRRLEDAVAAGDPIYAVIRGAAANNDGAAKSSYSAPSVDGQREVIVSAITLADVEPDSIGYVEAHGTGTPLGDPIEVEAITKAFRECEAVGTGTCVLGSLKSNIGHLEAAAGIAGLIKAALAVRDGIVPGTLNFSSPNPHIDFANSPFRVSAQSAPWPEGKHPRRAGVSSFGVGGTNAHVVIEQAPDFGETEALEAPEHARPTVITLSARSPECLPQAAGQLAGHLEAAADIACADVAATLNSGRETMPHRLAIAGRTHDELISALRAKSSFGKTTTRAREETPNVVFMFPGQGAQRAGMLRDLYRTEHTVRTVLDHCAPIAEREAGIDVRELLLAESNDAQAAERLRETRFTQPCLFIAELAMARLWQSWGVNPTGLIGHSVGEYAAACLADVISVEDALCAISRRGALVQAQPPGAMLAVRLREEEISPLVPEGCSIAAINALDSCAVAGPDSSIAELEARLEKEGRPGKRLMTSHAFHSPMMDAVVEPLTATLAQFTLGAPKIAIASTVTAKWMTAEDAMNPAYWGRHARNAVRFADGLGTVLSQDGILLLEVGPGRTLTQLARRHPATAGAVDVIASQPMAKDDSDGALEIAEAAARLWTRGVPIDWRKRDDNRARKIVSLPGYPFARTRFWIEPPAAARTTGTIQSATIGNPPASVSPLAPANPTAAGANVEPRTERILRELQELIEDVSGTPMGEVSPDETLLDLGFDSLLLAQVSTALRDRFGVGISFRQLMKEFTTPVAIATHIDQAMPPDPETKIAPINTPSAPPAVESVHTQPSAGNLTIEAVIERQLALMEQQLALLRRSQAPMQAEPLLQAAVSTTRAAILRAQEDGRPPTKPAADPQPEDHRNTVVALTEEQREMWMAYQMSPAIAASFNVSGILIFNGRLDEQAFAKAVRSVTERHEALRISFLADGSGQTIRPQAEIPVQPIDLPEDPQERAAFLMKEAKTLFDLEQGPPIRFLMVNQPDRSVLVMTVNHLACDGWSFNTVLGEIAGYYSATVRKLPPPSFPPAVQISAFAADESKRAASPEARAALDFWRTELADMPTYLELPADHPRPEDPRYTGGRETHLIPFEIAREARAFARRNHTTPFSLFFSVFGCMLHRLTGSRDMLIGVPVAGQHVHNVHTLVGHCVNFLPVRHRVDPQGTFEYHLQRTREALFNAFEHAQVSFGRLLREVQWKRDPSRLSPLGVTFNLDPPTGEIDFGGVAMDLEVNPTGYVNTDFSVNIMEESGGLLIECDYSAELFKPETIRRWLGYFQNVLEAAIRAPTSDVGKLPLLAASEREEILRASSRSAQANGSPQLLHQLFEAQVARSPNAIAVSQESDSLSYRELDERANQLAHRLVSLGAAPDQCVAIVLERSIEFLVSVLGVLKSGAALVPIDPKWPAERQAHVLRDCSASVVVSTKELMPTELPASITALDLGAAATDLACEPKGNPDIATEPKHLAYVIYTSGSTGEPKGVMVEHRAIAAHIPSIAQVYGLSSQDRCLLFHSVAFDPTVEQTFSTFHAGARLILRPANLWTGAEFAEKVSRSGLTVSDIPPRYWLQILQEWHSAGAVPDLGKLRLVIVGGEALPPLAVNLWRELTLTRIRMINSYGPTECSVTATTHELPAKPPVDHVAGRIPIGKPHGPVQAYVLDESMELVPAGMKGELWLGGPTVARGYLGREDLTREKFFPHPFRLEGRIYRTGDQARLQADGTIEFLKRIDRQVQVRGFRVELGEIESHLVDHPQVANAVVLARAKGETSTELVAYIEEKYGLELSTDALRDHLSQFLPAYMIPARFMVVEEFPADANGKVDLRALEAISAREIETEIGIETPRNGTEERLVAIWCRLLERDSIGIQDDFFTLGGHSLLAMQLVQEIAIEFDHTVSLAQLLSSPTIEALAKRIGVRETATTLDAHVRKAAKPAGTTLFNVPGIYGYGLLPIPLAEQIKRDRPYHDGLQLPGADGAAKPLETLEEMAAHLIRQIREVRSEGPYSLTGFCFGGLLAFEVACQLQQAGEEVRGLVLWHAFPWYTWQKQSLVHRLANFPQKFASGGNPERAAFLRHVLLAPLRPLANKTGLRQPDKPADVDEPPIYHANTRAGERYRIAEPFRGPMHVIRGLHEDPDYIMQPKGGWEQFDSGALTVHDLDCEHLDMVSEPLLSRVSAMTAQLLREADLEITPREPKKLVSASSIVGRSSFPRPLSLPRDSGKAKGSPARTFPRDSSLAS